MLEKNSKWRTFSGLGPTSFSYSAKAASPHRSFGSKPCNYVCKTISDIIEKIPLKKFGKEITSGFEKKKKKTVTKFQHLFRFGSVYFFIKIKKTRGYLPLLSAVFRTPPFPILKYPYTFVIPLPFLFFLFSLTNHGWEARGILA